MNLATAHSFSRRAGLLIVVACWAAGGPAAAQEQPGNPFHRFDTAAGKALDAMVREAESRKMKGVAAVVFVPGDRTLEWSSRMRAVDSIVQGKANVLAIAYCKISEMADTLEDSGGKVRPPLHGELGYRGGAIRKVPGGHLLAAFSGGKDTDDLAVANVGLDVLEQAIAGEAPVR